MGKPSQVGTVVSARLSTAGRPLFPLMSGSVVLLAGSAVAADLGGWRLPVLLLWMWPPLAAAVTCVAFLQLSRASGLPAPTRRFWRHLAVAAMLVTVAYSVQLRAELDRPLAPGQHSTPGMLAVAGAAAATVVWALYRLPTSAHKGERLRVVLDAGTVALAAAVFVVHFHTRRILTGEGHSAAVLLVSAMIIVVVMVAVFAVTKVVLTGRSVVDRHALRLLAYALFFAAVAPMTWPALPDHPHLDVTLVSVPVVMFLAVLAAHRQRRADGRGSADSSRNLQRQPFSALPYAAVAAVDALLLITTWSGTSQGADVVALAAVAVTALVVLRQLIAFQDNRRLMAELDHSATHDPLTGLPNRVLFGRHLQAALGAPGPDGLHVALIDLDGFKDVNDTVGHHIGDALLEQVAQRLTACIAPNATVARLGGDEFVLLLPGNTPTGADAAVADVIAAIEAGFVVQGHHLRVGASIGIADGRYGDDANELLRRADVAMYAAKRLPGSAYRRYLDGMAQAPATARQPGTGCSPEAPCRSAATAHDAELSGR